MSDNYSDENKNMSDRPIDFSALKTYETLGERFVIVSKMEIRTWKALTIVAFIAGLAAACIWFVSYQFDQETFTVQLKTHSDARLK
jgi:hypothetical protein